MNATFLQELLNTLAEQGRNYLPSALTGVSPGDDIEELARALVSGRGEASGVAIAHELLVHYRRLKPEGRLAFFRFLATAMRPDAEAVARAAAIYLATPDAVALHALQGAVESPRQEFFRRLNLAPGATADIVAMRRDLLKIPRKDADLSEVDADLEHLLSSWFNRGFLVLRRIDWQTPAVILEKIIAYEAVHEIQGWDDLRRRLDPADRRCFAFFHPSLIDEPLIFVEVALMNETPAAIQSLIDPTLQAETSARDPAPTTAVFYSISNCQEGLRGISFGNFLIKQVVDELARERPSLKTFVTLSPVPTFARWLQRTMTDDPTAILGTPDRKAIAALAGAQWHKTAEKSPALKATLLALAAHYFLRGKDGDGRPVDPVARFHLGNGARLERINWLGDISEKGLRESHGLMVNYRYELAEIEKNHEAFANEGTIAAAKSVRSQLKPLPAKADATRRRLLPGRDTG